MSESAKVAAVEDTIDVHEGGFLSNVCLACMPVWDEHKIVNMIGVCLDTTITTSKCSRYTFRPFDSAPAQAVAFAPYLVSKMGAPAHVGCVAAGGSDPRGGHRGGQDRACKGFLVKMTIYRVGENLTVRDLLVAELAADRVAEAIQRLRCPALAIYREAQIRPARAAFRQSLRQLGYIEGQNILIDTVHAGATVSAANAARPEGRGVLPS